MKPSGSKLPVVGVLALSLLLLPGCADGTIQPADAGDEPPLSPYWSAIGGYSLDDAVVVEESGSGSAGLVYGDLVAACMKEQGFEYWPEPEEPPASDADDGDEFSIERAEREGYGIVAPYRELEYQPVTEETAETDPNQYYTSKMSESMFAAYAEALFGPDWAGGDPEGVDFDWRDGGCDAAARQQIEAEGLSIVENENEDSAEGLAEASPYDDLIEMMNAIPDEVESTDGWRRVLDQWSACMGRHGHSYDSWDHTMESLIEEYAGLMSETHVEDAPLDDVVFLEEDQEWLPDRAKYETLFEKERAVAVADIECRIEGDLDGATEQIIGELEQQFVDRHRERLDEMKRWFEAHPSLGE